MNKSKEIGLDKKRAKETRVVSEVIGLYCRKKHGSKAFVPNAHSWRHMPRCGLNIAR